jgi:hypothetical protein
LQKQVMELQQRLADVLAERDRIQAERDEYAKEAYYQAHEDTRISVEEIERLRETGGNLEDLIREIESMTSMDTPEKGNG